MNAFEVILVLTIFLMVNRGAILRSKYPRMSKVSTFMECLAVTITTYMDKMTITDSTHMGTKLVLLIYRKRRRNLKLAASVQCYFACSQAILGSGSTGQF